MLIARRVTCDPPYCHHLSLGAGRLATIAIFEVLRYVFLWIFLFRTHLQSSRNIYWTGIFYTTYAASPKYTFIFIFPKGRICIFRDCERKVVAGFILRVCPHIQFRAPVLRHFFIYREDVIFLESVADNGAMDILVSVLSTIVLIIFCSCITRKS